MIPSKNRYRHSWNKDVDWDKENPLNSSYLCRKCGCQKAIPLDIGQNYYLAKGATEWVNRAPECKAE